MINHISFALNNFEESRHFYDRTLVIFGYERLMNFENEDHQLTDKSKKLSHLPDDLD